MDNEQFLDIGLKRVKPDAQPPRLWENGRTLDLFSAEDVFILPNETIAVSTGYAFIFPDEIGIMIMPANELRKNTYLRYINNVEVLENDYYFKDEVKINLQNTYSLKEDSQKVSQYQLINGNTVTDSNSLYIEGTVKICKGDCIAWMMPVPAAYNGVEKPTEKPAKK